MLREHEYDVLIKYIDGAVMDDDDRHVLYDLGSIGLVRFGMNTATGAPRGTAVLTEIGRRRVQRDRIHRSRLKEILYSMANIFS